MTAVAARTSTRASESVSPSRAQPRVHTATGTAESFFGHAQTVPARQKKRSPSFGQVAKPASVGGRVAGTCNDLQSDSASDGSRASSSFSIAQPDLQAS